MVKCKRWFIHLFTPPWRWRMAFSAQALKAIEQAVQMSERRHSGELRFVIENTLAPSQLWRGMSARQRALEVFANLHVWDTEENSGVLIYLLLADKEVHIVADRGINKRVAQSDWDAVAQAMQSEFRKGDFPRGSLEGVARITALLAIHFPAEASNPNELSDAPVLLSR